MVEARTASLFAIFVTRPRGQGNGVLDRLALARFTDEVEPIAIRQSEIADQNVEAKILEQGEGIVKIFRRSHMIADADEQPGEGSTRVIMVFDYQDVHTLYSELGSPCA